MIQRVSELDSEPIVGKYYLVSCILIDNDWIAIIGPRHEDKDLLNFPSMHYHRDVRFISERVVRRANVLAGCTREEVTLTTVVLVSDPTVERRMQCKRAMPDFPLYSATRKGKVTTWWFRNMEEVYKDATLKSCMTCPHRGMSLKNLPVKNGLIVCNGHGLQFSAETGKLVSRL